MAEQVFIRGPDGAVTEASAKAFEIVYRPKGFTKIDIPTPRGPQIVFVASDSRGGSQIRSFWPAWELRLHGVNARTVPGWPLALQPGAVVVLHRYMSRDVVDWCKSYRDSGVRVLFQVDDDLSCIPASNHWQASPGQLERHDAAIASSDGLIVTTKRLAEVYGPLARRCDIVPNYLPRWVSSMRTPERNWGAVRVGWAGTRAVHLHDLQWLAPEATRALKGAIFTTVGDHTVPEILGLDPRRAVALPWIDEPKAFYRAMGRTDVGIVPLLPCPFNEAKSWLKALEFVSLGVPVVATATTENRALLDGTGAGFLASTPAEMASQVQALVRDAPLRAEMAKAALALGERLSLERHWREWARPLQSVKEEATSGAIRI